MRTGQNGSVAFALALAHTKSFATYENNVGCVSRASNAAASACAGETGENTTGEAPIESAFGAASPRGGDAIATERTRRAET